jgi:protein archease
MLDLIPGEAAFRAYGANLGELFSNAGLALFSVMADLGAVEPELERSITLENPSIGQLFHDFLSELVYLKDADAVLFSRFEVDIRKNETYHLNAKLHGEPINLGKHRLGVDVKGVTLHRYKFEQLPDGYEAQVVLDI